MWLGSVVGPPLEQHAPIGSPYRLKYPSGAGWMSKSMLSERFVGRCPNQRSVSVHLNLRPSCCVSFVLMDNVQMDKVQCNVLLASTWTKKQKDGSNERFHSVHLNLRPFEPVSFVPVDVN